jgi:hypothetical protein
VNKRTGGDRGGEFRVGKDRSLIQNEAIGSGLCLLREVMLKNGYRGYLGGKIDKT